jgi:hypothetical protein
MCNYILQKYNEQMILHNYINQDFFFHKNIFSAMNLNESDRDGVI